MNLEVTDNMKDTLLRLQADICNTYEIEKLEKLGIKASYDRYRSMSDDEKRSYFRDSENWNEIKVIVG